jgi:tight adherence protein C
MSSHLVAMILILTTVFLLVSEDISWEKLSIGAVHKIGDQTNVRVKLNELGYFKERSYEDFRYRQIILIFLFLSVELLFTIFLEIQINSLAIIALFTIASILILTERSLNREVRRYRESIESDFPAIVEALTLSLSAGESPLTSMQRISSRGQGALATEFTKVIEGVTRGEPFATSLDAMGRRINSVAVRRFVDAIVIAITRGAPLIEVLHSHASEARDFQRNRVLSAASKAELSMMIPVVFLILPISILFALWPSLSNLKLFAQS